MKLHPKNVLADPNYGLNDDDKSADDVVDGDNLQVDSPSDVANDEQLLEEDQNDFIKDSGFVAITDQTILM